jgi:hypothetical protein
VRFFVISWKTKTAQTAKNSDLPINTLNSLRNKKEVNTPIGVRQ